MVNKEYRRTDHLDYMIEHIAIEQLFEDLVQEMTNREVKELFDSICRMRGIPYYRP